MCLLNFLSIEFLNDCKYLDKTKYNFILIK